MTGVEPAIIGGALTLAGSGINAASTGKTNKKTRRFNQMQTNMDRMYDLINFDIQNSQELANWNRQNEYNLEMWNMQNRRNDEVWNRENEYNSPKAQMARFKEAGLNPNLIFGQTNQGGSIATANYSDSTLDTPSMGSSKGRNYQGIPPQFDLQGGIQMFNAMRQQAAQISNIEAQTKAVQADTALKVVDRLSKEFDYGFKSEMKEVSQQALIESLRSQEIQNKVTLNRDEREAATTASGLREAMHRIALMRKQEIGQDLDNDLKQLDKELREKGINPHDPVFFRILGRAVDKVWEKIPNDTWDFDPKTFGIYKRKD